VMAGLPANCYTLTLLYFTLQFSLRATSINYLNIPYRTVCISWIYPPANSTDINWSFTFYEPTL